MTHHIHDHTDWQALREKGADTVIDPMIVRAGHVFMTEPPPGKADFDTAREVLTDVNTAIRDFIDHILLNAITPIFNYDASYFDGYYTSSDLIAISDHLGIGIVDVVVSGLEGEKSRSAALDDLDHTLQREYRTDAAVTALAESAEFHQLAASVEEELSRLEYRFDPQLDALEKPPPEALMNYPNALTMLYGDLLFERYTERLGGVHTLHTKRLDLITCLTDGRAGMRDVLRDPRVLQQLADKVNEHRRQPLCATAVIPSFVSYLLRQNPQSVHELFEMAVELRDSDEVVQLRSTLKTLRATENGGAFEADACRELAANEKTLLNALRLDKLSVLRPVALTASGILVAMQFDPQWADPVAVGSAALASEALFAYFTSGRKQQKFLTQLRDTENRWKEQQQLVELWVRGARQ